MALTVKSVEREIRPGRYFDGGGLVLVIKSRAGVIGKFFMLQYRSPVTGKDREKGLGSVRTIGLVEARKLAAELRAKIKDGIDPLEPDPAEAAPDAPVTFEQAAQACIKKEAPGWRTPKTEQAWRSSLSAYAFSKLGSKAVGEITRQDVAEVLKPVWLEKPEMSHKLRQRIEVILDFAVASGHAPDDRPNPAQATERLLQLLPKKPSRTQRVQHHPALGWRALPDFMVELAQRPALATRMLEVTILTASRSHMTRGARWSEFDPEMTVWTLAAARMKESRSHRIPLAPQATAILRALPVSGGLLFSVDETEPSINVMRALLIRMGRSDISTHGFRATFANWAIDNGHPAELVEICLAHQLPEVQAAYRRTDAFEARIVLMREWADYCFSNRG